MPDASVSSMPDITLRNYADAAAQRNGIPTDYFSRFLSTESGWNPSATGAAGEQGIAQIIPADHPGIANPYDPYQSIDYAASTIRSYFDTFGSWDAAFAAWNAGPARAQNPPGSTMDYVDKILGAAPMGTAGRVKASETVTGAAIVPDTFRIVVYGIAIGLLIIGIFGSLRGKHIPALQPMKG